MLIPVRQPERHQDRDGGAQREALRIRRLVRVHTPQEREPLTSKNGSSLCDRVKFARGARLIRGAHAPWSRQKAIRHLQKRVSQGARLPPLAVALESHERQVVITDVLDSLRRRPAMDACRCRTAPARPTQPHWCGRPGRRARPDCDTPSTPEPRPHRL